MERIVHHNEDIYKELFLNCTTHLLKCIQAIDKSSNANEINKKKYDANSVELNQKILRLLLRLSFHTANHLVRLKDRAKIRAENEVDKDLHDITIEDLIQGISMNQQNSNESQVEKTSTSTNSDPAEIQGRFLNFIPQAFEKFAPLKIDKTVQNFANGNISDITNVPTNIKTLASKGAEALENIQNKSLNASNSTFGQMPNSENLLNLTNVHDTMGKIISSGSNLTSMETVANSDIKNFNPLIKFLPDFNEDTASNVTIEYMNESGKIGGRIDSNIQNLGSTPYKDIAGSNNQSSMVIKRETSPVPVSVSTHVMNQMSNDYISVGNFSTSNITDSSSGVNVIKGNSTLVHDLLELKTPTIKDNRIICTTKAQDTFQYIFDDSDIEEGHYGNNVMKLLEEMNLQDLSNQIISIL